MEIVNKKRFLNKKIRKAKNIYIMGHKDLDLDAIGSSIGMNVLLNKKKKNCFLIIDDKEHELGVAKVLRELEGCLDIVTSKKIKDTLHPNKDKNLLLILDTNKKELVQSQDALKLISNQIIIDHHDVGKSTIKSGELIIDTNASSTCEMITNLIESSDSEIDSYYATVILAGIVLDTNNFTLKTSAETYYAAYYLASLGASAKKVQYLLKQDLNEYIEREKMLTGIEIIGKRIAITKATPYTVYRREDLAKIADILLFFNDIEASFVIGKIGKNTIGVSARSLGNYDISKILVTLGGGGDAYNGAAKIENENISQVMDTVKSEIKKQEGE